MELRIARDDDVADEGYMLVPGHLLTPMIMNAGDPDALLQRWAVEPVDGETYSVGCAQPDGSHIDLHYHDTTGVIMVISVDRIRELRAQAKGHPFTSEIVALQEFASSIPDK